MVTLSVTICIIGAWADERLVSKSQFYAMPWPPS